MRSLPFALFFMLTELTVAACNAKDKGMNEFPEISANIKKQLAFTCTQEKARIPPRDAEADQLYRHARWLVKGNVLKQDPAAYPPIERLLRIATAYGHDEANIELRGMLENAQAVSADPVNEVIDLVQDLIKRGIPAGYYDMGWYLEHGYGVRADRELAFKYYRKSADLGSPQGQYMVGKLLINVPVNGLEISLIGLSMHQCAADQRYAEAANALATHQRAEARYGDAIKYFQIATAEGSSTAASVLSRAFNPASYADPALGLGQLIDPERQARYYQMAKFLSDFSYLTATVPEIDQIVPLPPAKLPPWDGKFKWLEDRKANVTPPLPTEARIVEMARAKGLDPKTGRPAQAAK